MGYRAESNASYVSADVNDDEKYQRSLLLLLLDEIAWRMKDANDRSTMSFDYTCIVRLQSTLEADTHIPLVSEQRSMKKVFNMRRNLWNASNDGILRLSDWMSMTRYSSTIETRSVVFRLIRYDTLHPY